MFCKDGALGGTNALPSSAFLRAIAQMSPARFVFAAASDGLVRCFCAQVSIQDLKSATGSSVAVTRKHTLMRLVAPSGRTGSGILRRAGPDYYSGSVPCRDVAAWPQRDSCAR